jgi:spermidine/putrescine transport system substrate-binding protein
VLGGSTRRNARRDHEPTPRPCAAARDDHAADQPAGRHARRRPARRLRLPRRLRRRGVGHDEAPQAAGFWDSQTKAGVLDFANWPLYMDQEKVGGKVVYPSLQDFTKETGIKVNYKEVINENDAFAGKITPSLKAGQPTGWDLMVITNGTTLDKLLRQKFLVELDHSKLPNFQKNADPAIKNPSYDPGNKYTIAWQSGLTALAYNPKLTKRPITSFNDLFDPAFKGKITMFGDDEDYPT